MMSITKNRSPLLGVRPRLFYSLRRCVRCIRSIRLSSPLLHAVVAVMQPTELCALPLPGARSIYISIYGCSALQPTHMPNLPTADDPMGSAYTGKQ